MNSFLPVILSASEGSSSASACAHRAGFFPSATAPGQNDNHVSSLAAPAKDPAECLDVEALLDSSLALRMTLSGVPDFIREESLD
jgi:hypothetical protein